MAYCTVFFNEIQVPMAFTGLLTVNKDTAKLSATLLSTPQANASTTSNPDANASAPTAAAAQPPNPPASSTTCPLPLQVELRSPYNDVVPIDLSYVDQGVYRAKYVPPYVGAFELSVKLCCEHLHGSPFTVHVQKRVKAFLTNEQLLRHSIGASATGPLSGDAISRPFLGLAALGNASTGGAASVRSGNRGNAIAVSVSALHVPTNAKWHRKVESGGRDGTSASGTRLRTREREASGSSLAESFTRARECDARDARSKSRPSNTTSGGGRSHSQTRPIGLGNGSLALTLPRTEYAASSIARRSPTNPNLMLSSTMRSAAGGGTDGDYSMRAAMSSSLTSSRLLAVPSGRYGQSVCNGVLRIGSRGKGPGEFLSPQGIAVCVGSAGGGGSGVASTVSGPGPDSSISGRILVTDAQNANVQVFAHDTRYVGQFGTRGKLSGQLQRPVGVCELPDGRVVVVDQENKWINVYDEHGRCVPISQTFCLLSSSNRFLWHALQCY